MKKHLSDTPPSLIVPIDVEAAISSVTSPVIVSPALADFTVLPYQSADQNFNSNNVFLAEQAVHPNFAAGQQLRPGIHLHWALPDALTHSVASPGIDFPAVPNRWLITRIFTDHSTSSPQSHCQAWVVESDYISPTLPTLSFSPVFLNDVSQIPCQPNQAGTSGQPYLIMGRVIPYENWPSNEPAQYCSKLTVLGYGHSEFAAYYPNCKTVFGFCDAAENLPDCAKGYLSYSVIGWYSDPAQNDPMRNPDVAAALAAMKWTLPPGVSATSVNYSLYSGAITNLCWNSEKAYAATPSLEDIRVAVGNNTAEALSVFIDNTITEGDYSAQTLLNALQTGYLENLNGGDPDAMIKIEEALHQLDFQAIEAGMTQVTLDNVTVNDCGVLWQVTKNPNLSQDQQQAYAPFDDLLPDAIADNLNTLNIQQQNMDQLLEQLMDDAQQIFADWQKFMYAQHIGQPANFSSTWQTLGAFIVNAITTWQQTVTTTLAQKQTSRDNAKTNLLNSLTAEYVLANPVSAPRYWQATDPVILLRGDAIKFVKRYGFDGADAADGKLVCRLSTEIANSFDADANLDSSGSDAVSINATSSGMPAFYNNSQMPYADIAIALLVETLFVDVNQVDLLLTVFQAADTSSKNPALINPVGFANKISIAQNNYLQRNIPTPPSVHLLNTAIAPERFAFKIAGAVNPWLPIKTNWQVEYFPVQWIDDATPYPSSFITDNFDIDELNQPIDLIFTGNALAQCQLYSGRSLLTPHAAVALKSQLDTFIQYCKDKSLKDTLQNISTQIKDWNILGQSLTGFTQSLIMKKAGLQLPVMDSQAKDPTDTTTSQVADCTATIQRISATGTAFYNPIRAGRTRLNKLRIIDVFGQMVDIDMNQAIVYVADALTLPPKVDAPEFPMDFFLPPRLTQASRLLFRWLSAQDQQVEMNSHPASTPICGWLVPNLLNYALSFYTTAGDLVGSLMLVGDPAQGIAPSTSSDNQLIWFNAPGNNDTINKSMSEVVDQLTNSNLKALIMTLYTQGNVAGNYFSAFMESLKLVSYTIEPQNYKQDVGNMLLMGKPIALCCCSLQVDLQGNMAASQSWEALQVMVTTPTAQRYNANLNQVQFPVQLGDINTLGDGLYGYFKINANGFDGTTYYSLATPASNPNISQCSFDSISLTCDPTAAPQQFCMLVDPRACIRATTGILPVKSIAIPPEQYTGILENLAMSFLIAPILTTLSVQVGSSTYITQNPVLALPAISDGYQWSWAEYSGDNSWTVKQEFNPNDSTQNGFISAEKLEPLNYNQQMIQEGWLILSKNQSS